MGHWYDYLNPIYDANQLLSGGGSAIPAQPGVGSRAEDPSRLVQDPTTGMFFDPSTGTTYTDATGLTPVTDPNVAQQVATNFQRSNAFMNGLQQTQQQQGQLAGTLQAAANGQGPSVGGAQLTQGLGQAANQQLAIAAGANGASGPLAQMLAARNIGNLATGTNQSAAIVRAQEAEAARQQLGQLLQNQATTNLTGATQFADTAASGQAAQQGLTQKAKEDNATNGMKILGAAFSGAGSALGA